MVDHASVAMVINSEESKEANYYILNEICLNYMHM